MNYVNIMDNVFAVSVIDDIVVACWSVHVPLLDRYLFCGEEQ